MNKFVYITDTHIKGTNIKTRTDNYSEAILGKIAFVIGYCKKKKVTKLIHGGDLFDNPNISDYIAGVVSSMFTMAYRDFGLELYYIAGNHDITGKNFTTHVNGKLAQFKNYEWFHFVAGDKPVEFKDAYLSGYHFDYDKEWETHFDMPKYEYKKGKLKILVLHIMATGDKRDLVIDGKPVLISYKSIVTDANLVLAGHFHPGFGIKKTNVLEHVTTIANPGSLARTNSFVAKETVGPALIYFEVDKGALSEIRMVPVPHAKHVFNNIEVYDRYEVGSNHSKFIKNLREFKNSEMINADIEMLIRTIAGQAKDLPFKITDRLISDVCMRIKKVREQDEK